MQRHRVSRIVAFTGCVVAASLAWAGDPPGQPPVPVEAPTPAVDRGYPERARRFLERVVEFQEGLRRSITETEARIEVERADLRDALEARGRLRDEVEQATKDRDDSLSEARRLKEEYRRIQAAYEKLNKELASEPRAAAPLQAGSPTFVPMDSYIAAQLRKERDALIESLTASREAAEREKRSRAQDPEPQTKAAEAPGETATGIVSDLAGEIRAFRKELDALRSEVRELHELLLQHPPK